MELAIKNRKLDFRPEKLKPYLLPLLASVLFFWLQMDYFLPKIQIVLAILVAPFVFHIEKTGRASYRYAFAAIFFLSLYYYLQIAALLFMSAGCLLFFTLESNLGKIGILPFFFLVCISPAMHYLVNISTFSIRMDLSHCAAWLLNIMGYAVENKGSFFILPDGSSYNVDTACIGLNMFNTGFSIAILFMAFAEQNLKKRPGIIPVLLIFLSTTTLLVISNLFRIIILVIFKSAPGTLSHELFGIASLLLYTLVPVYFMVRFITNKFGKKFTETGQEKLAFRKSNVVLTVACSILLVAISISVKKSLHELVKDEKLARLELSGYSKQLKEDGVYEFRNKDALIYIKPACKGYESDNPPSMCWQGSGFSLEELNEMQYQNFTIFQAKLKRDTLVQYTAWWYDNGTDKTISQWRWRFANGEPYRIMNITTKTENELEKLCLYYLNNKLF